jgi:hypothetical protein
MITNELLMHDSNCLCKLAGLDTVVRNPTNVPAKGFEMDCKGASPRPQKSSHHVRASDQITASVDTIEIVLVRPADSPV